MEEHKISLTTDQPVISKAYLVPFIIREPLKKELNELQQ